MLTMLFLSADSAFAALLLRFLGGSRRDLKFVCCSMGLADGIALLLGYFVRSSIVIALQPPPKWIFWVLSVGFSTLAAKTIANRPRATIVAMAILFSIDNFFAGMCVSTVGRATWAALFEGSSAMLVSWIAFASADAVAAWKSRLLFVPWGSASKEGAVSSRLSVRIDSLEEVRCRL